MLYKVFIDDSGFKEYINPYSREFVDNPPDSDQYSQFWRDNYFVLCAVRVNQKHINDINIAINTLKTQCFGTKKVEIKSNWLRNPKDQKKHYLQKYGITKQHLINFVNRLYGLIKRSSDNLKLIGVVFDKRFYGDRKRSKPDGTPLYKCSQVLFERLQYLPGHNLVYFDQFESHLKLDKGHHEKILNIVHDKDEFEQVYVKEYNKIVDIKFTKSSVENFIQIADLCAYNIYRQFVHHGRVWQESETGNLPVYEFFDRIRCNFISHPVSSKVVGCGLICIPAIGNSDWNLLDGCDV